MVDVSSILGVVQLITGAAFTARQNKYKCMELAERAGNLAYVLPNFAHTAASDMATARVLERLHHTLSEALRLIRSCQAAGIFSGKYSTDTAILLDNVDQRINNCIMDLNLISQSRGHGQSQTTVQEAGPIPAKAHVDHHSSYYQAQGAASSTHVAWPPTPQHQHAAWSTPQGYYLQPPGYAPYTGYTAPYTPPYTAPPAPSGSNLSTFYTLPTVNKIFKNVFR